MVSVLYVDDEPDLLDIGKAFLERYGDFSVSTIDSATGALDLLKNNPFDAVVSDYLMPGMDGLELLKQVRLRFGQIPFILFTGRGREEVVILALNLGADFYLQKGGDPNSMYAELAHKVKQAIQKRRAELSLQESERRYREVVETQSEFISRFRPDGTHVFVNDAYCRHFGMRRDEIIGHRFVPSIPEEDIDLVRRHFASFTPEHPDACIEHRVIMPDGSIRWHWWNDHAIFDESGKVIEFQSIGKDITDRKQAGEDLKRSENLYRTVFTTTGAATLIIAPDTTILHANIGWERITGIPREQQENKLSWTVFFEKEDADRMVRYHHDRRKDPSLSPDVYESRLIDVHKQVHYCVVHVQMIPGTMNSVASLVDITERKKTEEALRESRQRFEDAMDMASLFTWDFDRASGRFLFNDRIFSLLGTSADREGGYSMPMDRFAREFVHPDDQGGMRQGVENFLKTQEPDYMADREARLIRRDGEIRHVVVRVRVIRGSDGSTILIQGTVQDITSYKTMIQELRESEERFRSLAEKRG